MLYPEFYRWMIVNRGLSKVTAYIYARKLGRFAELFEDAETLSSKEVAENVAEISKSRSDQNGWVAALRKYEEFCLYQGTPCDMSKDLKTQSGQERLPKPFSPQEIDALCEAVPIHSFKGKRDRIILELLYCGLRNQEVCSILVNNLDDRTVFIVGKGAKERYVPINDVAWYLLTDYVVTLLGTTEELELAGEYGIDFAFVRIKARLKDVSTNLFSTATGIQIYPRAIRRIVKDYAEAAGVVNAHPHRFRHSFATHTLDEGLGNLTALKDVLGHSSFEMVQRYVLTTKIGRERVRSFHPRQRRRAHEIDV